MHPAVEARSAIPTVAASSLPALTAAAMGEVDRLAIEDYGITLLQMMEQAGSHLAEVVRLELGGDLRDRNVVVAVGPGNNGGGGLVAARHLLNRGASVRVVLARPALRMTEASRHQLATLLAIGMSCCVAIYDLSDGELEHALAEAEIVVDAVLGYRADGPPHGEVEQLVTSIVESTRPVVSLDVPSGTNPDTGLALGTAISARATLTLALPKTGLLADGAGARVGRLYLADLGLPAALYTGLGLDVGPLFASGRIIEIDRTR